MQVLCLHLKRFRWNLYFRVKVDTYVEFPLNGLNMSHYVLNNLVIFFLLFVACWVMDVYVDLKICQYYSIYLLISDVTNIPRDDFSVKCMDVRCITVDCSFPRLYLVHYDCFTASA